ncbi:MAG: ADP-heptose--LPS heptosyltransferase [Acidobacteria bacterium OLB17]|nr:MAG: ADP-heptose--LPS heptosyltransferase [Acidobacteria bacterium OLB17]MCZ2390908.1 glycosyltransferase family 9 protein [Acidobacteriota bacterium]
MRKNDKIDWGRVRRVLVIRLRSIGDTVLATPVLTTLRRELPNAEVDILLEDRISPLLEGFEGVGVQGIGAGARTRLQAAGRLRTAKYDAVINLHGGSTSSTLAAATLARYRLGFSHYRFPRTYTHLYGSPADLWGTDQLHSVEQQLAILGLAGMNVDRSEPTSLPADPQADAAIGEALGDYGPLALMHPAAAYDTKTWPAANFAKAAEHLAAKGFTVASVAAPNERPVIEAVERAANCEILSLVGLPLPQITAVARRAGIFIGNDSGIAHIAAAVGTPSVVIFGSSNRVHWRPWTTAPSEIVFNEFPCQPCPGDICRAFDEPRCILSINPEPVIHAIDRVLAKASALTGQGR